jgi:hypothetical protein
VLARPEEHGAGVALRRDGPALRSGAGRR